jgi:hypothetical protein
MLRPIIIPIVPRQRPLCPFVQARTGRSSSDIENDSATVNLMLFIVALRQSSLEH